MATIQDLPGLVVIGILKETVDDVYECCQNIVRNLQYLAICRQWRYLALPIVYKNLLIRYDCTQDEGNEEVYKFSSNISLMANDHCNPLVRRLQISWERYWLMDNLDMLMNTIAMGNQTWPRDVSGHLVGNAPDDSNDYNPQKLDNEMYEKMSAIIDNFRDTFPNIKEIGIEIYDSCGVASQFVSKFVDVYSDQLTMFMSETDVPLDLPCFPPNLEYLLYRCQPMTFMPMPKINSLPLKVLRLRGIPKDYSWRQCCSSLVFPNLKKLSIYSLPGNYQSKREELAHNLGIKLYIPDSQQEQLEFPVIYSLKLYLDSASTNRFNIKKMSQHLRELAFSSNLEGLEHISKLSCNSIYFLDVYLDDGFNDATKFYKVANKMLGSNIKSNASTLFQYLHEDPTIDFQRTSWGNVTFMNIQSVSSTSLIEAIKAMPRLGAFDIKLLAYIDEVVDWSSVANSKIGMLILRDCQHGGQVEKLASYIMQLLKSLKYLQDTSIPESLHDVLLPKLVEAKKEHQHLQELEIEWI